MAALLPEDSNTARPRGRLISSATSRIGSLDQDCDLDAPPRPLLWDQRDTSWTPIRLDSSRNHGSSDTPPP